MGFFASLVVGQHCIYIYLQKSKLTNLIKSQRIKHKLAN